MTATQTHPPDCTVEPGPGMFDAADMVPEVYAELRAIAGRYLARCAGPVSLEPTALVHEAYVHLARQHGFKYRDAGHARALTCLFMRRVLSDHLREKRSLKHGARMVRVALPSDAAASLDRREVDLLALNDALDKLERVNPEGAQIAALHYHFGLPLDEISRYLGMAPSTLDTRMPALKAWLRRELAAGAGS